MLSSLDLPVTPAKVGQVEGWLQAVSCEKWLWRGCLWTAELPQPGQPKPVLLSQGCYMSMYAQKYVLLSVL